MKFLPWVIAWLSLILGVWMGRHWERARQALQEAHVCGVDDLEAWCRYWDMEKKIIRRGDR